MWTEIYIFELEFSRFTSEIKTERTLKFNILWKKKKKMNFQHHSWRRVIDWYYTTAAYPRTRLSAD